MGITGTDVTKQTADMVLTDDNFASIISAVEQGRVIFSNIRKFVYYLMSCNLGEIGTLFFGTMFGWPLPLSAIQLLWTNLITDGAPALALGLEKGEPDLMKLPPRPTKEPIINKSMRVSLVLQTVAITGASLLAFWLGWKVLGAGMAKEAAETLARTMAFVTLSGCQLVRAYTNRSERASLFTIGPFSNKFMQYAVLSSAALLLATLFVPYLNTSVFRTAALTGRQWLVILPGILLPAVVDEVTKFFIRRSGR
jgi:P-type Ca2+ transporter type 2C